MGAIVLVGCQWGDEGKGRVVDVLAERSDIVVRFQGGPNAGHTLVEDVEEIILHLIPSGILRPNTVNVLGNGMVIDPYKFVKELDMLERRGIDISPDRIKVSDRAHLILPSYIEEDGGELSQNIGTTKSGIGQTYTHKFIRDGVRVKDLAGVKDYRKNIVDAASDKLGKDIVDIMLYYSCDTADYLNYNLEKKAKVLLEGAQAIGLDIDHGTYPFVTSSNPTTGGALTGTGISWYHIEDVVGIAKAYTTRVGEGPFDTELKNEIGNMLFKKGGEKGASTGRNRRCGWYNRDAVARACQINGVTTLAITKLDVLSGFSPHVMTDGSLVGLLGWDEDITEVRNIEDLPVNAQEYVDFISDVGGRVELGYVSVSPKRDNIIII